MSVLPARPRCLARSWMLYGAQARSSTLLRLFSTWFSTSHYLGLDFLVSRYRLSSSFQREKSCSRGWSLEEVVESPKTREPGPSVRRQTVWRCGTLTPGLFLHRACDDTAGSGRDRWCQKRQLGCDPHGRLGAEESRHLEAPRGPLDGLGLEKGAELKLAWPARSPLCKAR